ncbi:unnamed protein product, partial [Ixodes persulcatus]
MFPWKKAKDKDDKSKRRDDKKGSSSGDGRRRHLVISGPIPTRVGGALVSPLPEEDDCPSTDAGPAPVDAKKPPPVPPKKPAVARTLSVPKARPPDRPAPRSSSLVAQPLASVFKQAVRNGHAVVDAQAPAARAAPVSAGLCLPPIRTALRCPQPRVLTVVRQPSGDFGFSLRRSALSDGLAGDDRRRTLMFAEPSTLGSGGGGTGLLPGDRLLEVNGASVDERTREEVVEMVRSSGDRVSLKVQPLPELCEIVARVAGGGPPGATQGRHRTLSRTGSRRHRTLGAKTDEEIAEERQWLQSEKVWVLFDGGYAGASLVKGDQVTPREGRVRVRLDATGELLDVDQEDVDKVGSSSVFPKHTRCNQSAIQSNLSFRIVFLRRNAKTRASRTLQRHQETVTIFISCTKCCNLRKKCCLVHSNIFDFFKYENATVVVNRSCPLALPRQEVSSTDLGTHTHHTFAEKRLRIDSSKLPAIVPHPAGSSKSFVTCTSRGSAMLSSMLVLALANFLHFTNASFLCMQKLFVYAHNFQKIVYAKIAHSKHKTRLALGACAVTTMLFSTARTKALPDYLIMLSKLSEQPTEALKWRLGPSATKTQVHSGHTNVISVPVLPAPRLTPLLRTVTSSSRIAAKGPMTALFSSLQMQRVCLINTPSPSIPPILTSIWSCAPALLRAHTTARAVSKLTLTKRAEQMAVFYEVRLADETKQVNSCVPFANRTEKIKIVYYEFSMAGKMTECEPKLQTSAISRNKQSTSPNLMIGLWVRSSHQTQSVLRNCCCCSSKKMLPHIHLAAEKALALARDVERNLNTSGRDIISHRCFRKRLLQILKCYFYPKTCFSSKLQLFAHTKRKNLLYFGGVASARCLGDCVVAENCYSKSLLRSGSLLFRADGREQRLVQPGPREGQFVLHHQLGSLPVTYGVQGWLRAAREGSAFRQAQPLLQESHKEQLAQLFGCSRGPLASAGSTLSLDAGASSSLRRTPSIRRAQSVAAAKRRSLPLQVKYTTDGMLEVLRRTRLHFVHCLVPSMQPLEQGAGGAADDAHFDVPLVRSQLKGAQVLDAVRLRKQGFPENLQYTEFRRRYSLLASADCTPERGDERAAVEALLRHLDMEPSSYRLGLSQIFLRAGTLSQLEAQRDERLSEEVVRLQARARGFLARRRHQQRKVQAMALCCIQRNVRRFLEIRSWPWWRLFVKIAPVLNVHRTEEQLKSTLEEVGQLRAKLEKAEKERSELRQNHDLLEAKVS